MQQIEKNNIPIWYESEIVKLNANDNIAECDRHNQNKTTLNYKYCLVCDGANSQLRDLLQLQCHKTPLEKFVNIEIKSNFERYIDRPALLNWIFHPLYPACLVMHTLNGVQNIQIPIFDDKRDASFNCTRFIEEYVKKCIIYQAPFRINPSWQMEFIHASS